jgi:hypothetical protein
MVWGMTTIAWIVLGLILATLAPIVFDAVIGAFGMTFESLWEATGDID